MKISLKNDDLGLMDRFKWHAQMLLSLRRAPAVTDSIAGAGEKGRCPPLTGCILRQVKILHENALFLH